MMNKVKPFRNDAVEKVTGNARYSGDFHMDGMLCAKVLWPKYPVARINKIDISKAEAVAGVEKVVTRRDIDGPNLAAVFEPYDRPVLVGAGEEVRFLGDALAIVVAVNEEIAEKALEKIEVEYEPLPGVYTLEESMAVNQPYSVSEITKGDIEEGFKKAEIIVENHCAFPYAEHSYIEPEAGYSYIDNQGVINVCYGSQNLSRHHRMVCKSLGLPFHKVRLYSPYIGGAFGGKHSNSVQVYLALLAHVVKKPVKMVWSREESFFAGCKRHKLTFNSKMGLTREGKIVALDVEILSESGPYIGYAEKTLAFAMRYACGPYWIDNMKIQGRIYKTNNAEIGAFRGFGASESTFMIETMMDKAAKELNMTPEAIRLMNLIRADQLETHFPGAPWKLLSDKISIEETLQKALDYMGHKPEAKPGKKIGRGIAVAMPCFEIGDTPGYKGTGADMTMFTDGTVNVRIGFPEVGQGITGVVTKVASEILDIPEDNISILYCDSHATPKAGSLGFSRGTVNCGNAVLDASKKLKNRLEEVAKKYLKTEEYVEFKKGDFYIKDQIAIKFDELMDYCYYNGVNLTVNGWFEGSDPVEKHGITFMSGVMDVEIDEETGELKVLKVVNCHDIGRAIHPDSARGQIVGGVVMMLGIATMEEFVMEDGFPATPSFAQYVIPTSKDIPEENISLFVENPAKDCPLGGKGLGEHAMFTTGPALSNAIYDAIGVSMTELPITPEKILKAMNKI